MAISKRNRRGIVWLIVLILLISFTPRIISLTFPDNELAFSFEELKEREAQLKTIEIEATESRQRYQSKRKEYNIPASRFDPNELKQDDWIDMGLSSKQADVIVKFTSHGIKSNEELKRIFVLPDKLFELIKDSTYYPSKEFSGKNDQSNIVKTKPVLIELNGASSVELQQIQGIGPFFGKKIVAYRDLLGGYASKQQLLEVYKMDQEKFDEISPFLFLNNKSLIQIKINEISLDELKKHPYLNYNQANSIVSMRDQHGPYKEIEGVLESKLIDRKLFNKLKPYLTIYK